MVGEIRLIYVNSMYIQTNIHAHKYVCMYIYYTHTHTQTCAHTHKNILRDDYIELGAAWGEVVSSYCYESVET